MSGRSGNQEDEGSYPSYGYTPSESDESQWQDTGDTAQGRQMGRSRTSTSDMVLAQRIALELQRQLPNVQNIHVLDPHAIYVVVNQNTVTLHGHVQDRNLKQQAEQIARSISGVQNVQNQLIVAGEAGAFPPLGYTPEQPSTTTGRSAMGTGQQMTTSDRNMAQQIDQQIRQQLSGANITVTVSQGTATLQGSVRDQNQKQQAEQIAQSISGIENVQNNLTVSGQQSRRPDSSPPMGSSPRRDKWDSRRPASNKPVRLTKYWLIKSHSNCSSNCPAARSSTYWIRRPST